MNTTLRGEGPAAPAQISYRQVLTTGNVPQLLTAAALSRLAHGMSLLVVVLAAMSSFHSASVAGLSGLFLTLPGFLASPVAGAVLDGLGALRSIAIDTLASAAFLGVIATLSVTGKLTTVVFYLLLALFSLTSPLTDGGIRTLFPRFVPDEAYDRANALDLGTYSVIEVGGPLVAGVLVVAVGSGSALFVIAAMYAVAAGSLRLLRGGTGPTEDRAEPRAGLLRSAGQGIRYLVRNPTLRGLAISYSVYQVAFGMLFLIVPFAVAKWAGTGSPGRQVGLLWSIAGLAGAAGALAAGKLVRSGTERRFMVGALAATAAVLCLTAASGSVLSLGAVLVLFAMLESVVGVSLLSLRQRRTDPQWLGRVMTVSISVNLIGFPVGTALGGIAVGSMSIGRSFAVVAAIAAVAALCSFLFVPKEPA